jgi:hypothetical protein
MPFFPSDQPLRGGVAGVDVHDFDELGVPRHPRLGVALSGPWVDLPNWL